MCRYIMHIGFLYWHVDNYNVYNILHTTRPLFPYFFFFFFYNLKSVVFYSIHEKENL